MFTSWEPKLGQGNSWVACQNHFILIMEIMNKFPFSNQIEPTQEIWRNKIQKIRRDKGFCSILMRFGLIHLRGPYNSSFNLQN